jgi:S-formylglutathione hydrolase FrmB
MVLDWSLLAGSNLTITIQVVGVAALLLLCAGRGRRWWALKVPASLVAGGLATFAVYAVVTWWWKPVAEPLPVVVWQTVFAALTAVGLAVARLTQRVPQSPTRRRTVWLRPFAFLAAVLLVFLAAGQTVNAHFGEFPTVRTALGLPPPYQVSFDAIARNVATVEGRPLDAAWADAKHGDVPEGGVVAQVDIPGTASQFPARPGMVYLPPAYLMTPRPLLPVLVLVAGQPGNPQDWINGGMLADRMNRYAAAHDGLAPVVVIPDNLGSPTANPMCIDSKLGNAATYLQVDVPNWVQQNLQVNMDPSAWAFGGLSNGGTCAVQMAVTAPQRYPTFIDLSGEDEPRTGSREKTVNDAFGGDAAAFARINPLDILASRRFPDSAGLIVVGADDAEFRPQSERIYQACLAAGMDVQFSTLPGGHSWQVWGPGLENSLPWLGSRLGLTK